MSLRSIEEPNMAETWELRVSREALDIIEIGDGVGTDVELGDGQVLFGVDSFAMTANNITYAVMGEAMAYWNFFPTEEGWGIVPVWGFADAVESTHPGVAVGDRFYGYWPCATHLVVESARVTDRGLVDCSAHRSSLPPMYNQYSRVVAEDSGDGNHEALVSLFRPLFMTSFFIDDMLSEDRFEQVERVAISSASSKTGFSLAFCLHRRGLAAIGLTSPGNVDFVRGLGWYDDVVTYDDIELLAGGGPLVFVDMAGNSAVRSAVHSSGADLVASIRVGATHWSEAAGAEPTEGPTPEMFFAPAQIAKRAGEWGQARIDERLEAAWADFVGQVDDLIQLSRVQGVDGAASAYLSALDGSADPAIGVIVEP